MLQLITNLFVDHCLTLSVRYERLSSSSCLTLFVPIEREAQLHLRRHQVEKLQEYFLQHTTNVLETRTEEKSRAVILLIDQMQTLSTAVSVIDTYILSGQYTQAVLHLSSSLEILFSKEMIHLNCFTEIRDTLMLKKQVR